jgi:hypothetical protein
MVGRMDGWVEGWKGGTEWKMNRYYVLTAGRFILSVRLVTKEKETNTKLNSFGCGKITC